MKSSPNYCAMEMLSDALEAANANAPDGLLSEDLTVSQALSTLNQADQPEKISASVKKNSNRTCNVPVLSNKLLPAV